MNKQINTGEIVIYQAEDGQASLEVKLIKETVWLNLNQMAGLFQRISRLFRGIFLMYSEQGSYQESQLLQNLQQLKLKVTER